MHPLEETVLARCQQAVPSWRGLPRDAFELSPPRGFSSFTMVVRCSRSDTDGVVYRDLAPKPNSLLGYELERSTYEALADATVAAPIIAYEQTHRIEALYHGRTLTRHDVEDPDILRKIGGQLARLHTVTPTMPELTFFELLTRRWRPAVEEVLLNQQTVFPPHEQLMCAELLGLLDDEVFACVQELLSGHPVGFAHNDTYHGNIMLLETGEVRLLDFEFSCRNVQAFDFANLMKETTLRHGLVDPPHFAIAPWTIAYAQIDALATGYLEAGGDGSLEGIREDVVQFGALSDYMYAMAATTLAVEPVQKIRFIPYALQRFRRFRYTVGLDDEFTL